MKISVIVPVYNVQSYLEDCVESVLNQTFQNIELLLIDDGSTDNSPSICDACAAEDSRVVTIHQPNGGLSDARNTGIRHATGDYILFLDSDDFWDDSHALERLVERAQISGADVVNYSYVKYYEKQGKKVPQFHAIPEMALELHSKQEQLNYLCSNFIYIASACNKMIRRSLFDSGLLFEKGRLSEDIEWCARLLAKAQSMDFICENFYCYRQREGSITHTMAEKACYDLTANIRGCIKVAKRSEETVRRYIYMYSAYQLSTFFAVQAMVEKCPTECIDTLVKYKGLLKYHGKNKKVTILYIGCKLLGFRGLCRAVRMTRKLWS